LRVAQIRVISQGNVPCAGNFRFYSSFRSLRKKGFEFDDYADPAFFFDDYADPAFCGRLRRLPGAKNDTAWQILRSLILRTAVCSEQPGSSRGGTF
jgi:hypothetical protein